ncbi:hypothetical protein JCM9140_1818 [Halalkalibacter wakoensis JCM 9140]|uniref:Lipoprotein n=1 Tax=Halalkalibacter wakoensis JCM 9140 TaxID=1236970 RepID=W4Q144_9BACI|nr:hypothetical protein [Halalkalibacter wakoensis]GAE25801.1 hypothetical protein JCM9140_1818 [Halalkalibacter wakoensis JCM 9140]
MIKNIGRISIWLSIFVFLAACQVTEEEALELGQIAYHTHLEEPMEPNTELSMVNVFLPRGFEVIDDIEYNVQLQSGDQLFLLFHQPEEPATSNIHFERDVRTAGAALLYELRESDEQLSYLIVTEEEEDQLFVIVTVGGAKISTLTTYNDLEENIEAMTSIVRSYHVD